MQLPQPVSALRLHEAYAGPESGARQCMQLHSRKACRLGVSSECPLALTQAQTWPPGADPRRTLPPEAQGLRAMLGLQSKPHPGSTSRCWGSPCIKASRAHLVLSWRFWSFRRVFSSMTSATTASGGVLGRSPAARLGCPDCTSAKLLGSEARLLRSSSLPRVLQQTAQSGPFLGQCSN